MKAGGQNTGKRGMKKLKNNNMSLLKFISEEGYKADSPDRNNPFNVIPSNRITMQNVPHPVYGVDNLGNEQMMMPGGEYQFPGNMVTEYPMMENGGGIQATHQMPDGSWMPGATHGEYEYIELTDEEIEEYRKGGYVVEEVDKAQFGRSIPVSDPNDPRLHMYLDSLNLYQGYQKMQQLFPETDTPGGNPGRWSKQPEDMRQNLKKRTGKSEPTFWDPNFSQKGTRYYDNFDEYWKEQAAMDKILAEKYTYKDPDYRFDRVDFDKAAKDPELDKLGWNDSGGPAFKTAKDLKQMHTASGQLAEYYNKNLSFRHPTSVGYWESPDLGSSKIAPSDAYFGVAWNPVYDKPTQPYEYTGDPADVEKLRHPAKISGVTRWAGKSAGTTDPKFSVAVNLRKRGMDSSFAARKKMAEEAGIEDYKGTKEQNIALNDYVFTNYEGDKKKASETVGGNKPKMEGPETFPISGLKAIRETVATPDPEAPIEAQRKTAEGKAPRVVSYTQEWDPVAKKWTQQPVIQDIAVAPGQYQTGGPLTRQDSANIYKAGKKATDLFKKISGPATQSANEYSTAYNDYQSVFYDLGREGRFSGINPTLAEHIDYNLYKKPEVLKNITLETDSMGRIIYTRHTPRPTIPHIEKVQPKGLPKGAQPTIDATLRKGIPPLPEPTIIGYTQAWNPVLKKWEQEPQYQTIAEPGMYAYGGDIQTGGGYNYNEINSLKEGGGINIKPSKRGTFKAQATKMGMGVQEAASKILNAPEGTYSPAMRKKANFAKNFAKQEGGEVYEEMDLTDEQIASMRAQGYIVEEL